MNILSPLLLSLFFFIPVSSDASTTLICPSDKWVNCGAEIWDLSIYGNAYYYVNGVQYDAGNASVEYDLTVCETGRIFRTWTIMDPDWNSYSCTQTIYVQGSNFNYHNIDWPDQDLHIVGCDVSVHPDNLPLEYSRPQYDHLSCSMVGSSYKDQVFYFGVDCKKILRTWTVLDWCNYFPGSSSPGKWTYTQTIKISGSETPELICHDDIVLLPDNCDGRQVDLNDLLVNGDACNGNYSVANDSPYAESNEANASGFYPIGTSIVNYTVQYGCGQQSICQQLITIKEKPAVPYCLSTLSIALMPVDSDGDGLTDDGMVELWAKDLDYASYHPCRPNEELRFSFSSNVDSSSMIFTCEHVGKNEMQLWVTDTRGNQSWCAVTVDVQNNAANIPDCEPIDQNMGVVGSVDDVFGEPISDVEINLRSRAYYKWQTRHDTVMKQELIDSVLTAGGLLVYIYDRYITTVPIQEMVLMPGVELMVMTDSSGNFVNEQVEPDRRYLMTAEKDPENTLMKQEDIELLERYINGEFNFKSKFSYLAADINEDNRVDALDLDILRQIIEGLEEWPNQRQWLFFDMKDIEKIPEGSNPLDYDLSKTIVLDEDLQRFKQQKFLGVLKGQLTLYEDIDTNELESRSRINLDPILYPNPVLDELTVNYYSDKEWSIKIFDLNGKELYSRSGHLSELKISEIEQWYPGAYYYRIESGENIYTAKIIKMN